MSFANSSCGAGDKSAGPPGRSDDVRSKRRAVADDSAPTSAGYQFDELCALLTDYRLVRVSDKKLVYSHIVGKAAGFLSNCCDNWNCELDAALNLQDIAAL